MKISQWGDYELIDATDGQRLERWGDIILIRPDPQIVWKTKKSSSLWNDAHAVYHRSNKGGGYWEKKKKIPDSWMIRYRELAFNIKLMNFKHTGIFPEQATNWDMLTELISNSSKQLSVLNMFAYTGAMSLACAKAGAKVCHLDSSKGMVSWGKENSKISKLEDKPIRWIVDDCLKFIKREQRRNNKYDIIIMDPPSYGRGPNGEVWRLEDQIYELIIEVEKILSKNAKLVLINSYTAGLSPCVMEYILATVVQKKLQGKVFSYETGLKVTSSGLALPCGCSAVWTSL